MFLRANILQDFLCLILIDVAKFKRNIPKKIKLTDYSLIIRYNHLKLITEAYLEIFFTILNIIKYLIYILIAIAIVIFIFLKVSPAFGGIPDNEAFLFSLEYLHNLKSLRVYL